MRELMASDLVRRIEEAIEIYGDLPIGGIDAEVTAPVRVIAIDSLGEDVEITARRAVELWLEN